MASFIKSAILLLVTPHCYEEYFHSYNFLNAQCLKSTVSKALGFGIIAGSITVKVPQIVKIVNNKSGEGISLLSVLLDLCAISFNFCYSYRKDFPFSAWGEGFFLAVQTAIIAILVLHYSNKSGLAALFVGAYSTLLYVLMTNLTPISLLWSLQPINIVIVIIGKSIQAYSNYRKKSTGQLSAVTCWLLFAGSVARIFTSVQETGDPIIILTYISTTLANGVIVAQLVYYSKKSSVKSPKKKSK